MIIKSFAKALEKGVGRTEPDRISGTSKIKTYVNPPPWLWSRESDWDRISQTNIHRDDRSIAYNRL